LKIWFQNILVIIRWTLLDVLVFQFKMDYEYMTYFVYFEGILIMINSWWMEVKNHLICMYCPPFFLKSSKVFHSTLRLIKNGFKLVSKQKICNFIIHLLRIRKKASRSLNNTQKSRIHIAKLYLNFSSNPFIDLLNVCVSSHSTVLNPFIHRQFS
jgi:hypothetical protein